MRDFKIKVTHGGGGALLGENKEGFLGSGNILYPHRFAGIMGAKRVFICKTSPQLSSCPIVLRMVLAASCWCLARLLHPRDRRAPGCHHLGLSGPEWEPWPHDAPLGRDILSLGLYVGTLGRALNPQNVISWGHMARKSPNMVLGQQPGAGTPESMWGGWLGGL